MKRGLLSGFGKTVKRESDYFTSSGVWVKPTWGKLFIVELLGGGGGGGGGTRTALGTGQYMGSGGQSGGYVLGVFSSSDLAGLTELAITIGSGGLGGQGATADGTTGTVGGDGGTTLFGQFLRAVGGHGGVSGNVTPTPLQSTGLSYGGDAFYNFIFNTTWDGGTGYRNGGGGAQGGGILAAGGIVPAGNAGTGSPPYNAAAGLPGVGGSPATSGGSGASNSDFTVCCGGGGGGGGGADPSGVTPGGDGGQGGYPSGGGGGGGAGTNGANGGTGGNGAAGFCLIVTYGDFL